MEVPNDQLKTLHSLLGLLLQEITAGYSAKLMSIAEGVKSGSLKYEEEFIVNYKTNTARLIVYLNGEIVGDHGVMKVDEEFDHLSDDGRPTKMEVVIESDAKLTAYEQCAEVNSVSVAEAVGDTLTVNNVRWERTKKCMDNRSELVADIIQLESDESV